MFIISLVGLISTLLFFIALGMFGLRGWSQYAYIQAGGAESQELESPSNWPIGAGVALVIVSIVVSILVNGMYYVEPTKVALRINTTNGNVESVAESGLKFTVPYIYEYIEYDRTVQTENFTKDPETAPGDVHRRIDVLDRNTRSIFLDLTIRWQVDPEDTNQIYNDFITIERLRNAVRETIRARVRSAFQTTGLATEDIATTNLNAIVEIATQLEDGDITVEEAQEMTELASGEENTSLFVIHDAILEDLIVTLEPLGVDPDSIEVLVRKPHLDPAFLQRVLEASTLIQQRVIEEQRGKSDLQVQENQTALQLEEERRNQEKQEIVNETNISRAEADAQANIIIAQGEADAERIRAQGEADAIQLVLGAYGDNETLIAIEAIRAINPNVQVWLAESGSNLIIPFSGMNGQNMMIPVTGDQAGEPIPMDGQEVVPLEEIPTEQAPPTEGG